MSEPPGDSRWDPGQQVGPGDSRWDPSRLRSKFLYKCEVSGAAMRAFEMNTATW